MNLNIEKINKYLYGASFSHIKMGWIEDFPLLKGGEIDNLHMSLTTDGKLILNKDDSELYNILKHMFDKKIMPKTKRRLQLTIQRIENKKGNGSDKYAEVYLWMLKTELKRRTIIAKRR